MSTPAEARSYDELWRDVYGEMQQAGPVHRHMRRLMRGFLSELDYRTVVDVGCGAGDNAALLRDGRSVDRLVGLDISEVALSQARTRDPDGEYVRGDIQTETLEDRFDLVVSALLVEHLPDDRAALRNMHSMTGRWLLVSTMAGDYERYRPWEEQVGHVRNYAPGELERALDASGFEVERTVYWGFPLYSPIVRLLLNRARARAVLSRGARLAAAVLYPLFFLNSSGRGDLVIALARPRGLDSATPTIESSRAQAGS
jgi:SAM-dependent methyltransferase